MSLYEMLATKPIDIKGIAKYLDGLTHEERVAEMRTIPGRQMALLWEAEGKSRKKLSVNSFVPKDVPNCVAVRHIGRNSLPLFNDFEKRFARPKSDAKELYGYNHSDAMGLVGPGQFVLGKGKAKGEMDVDYYRIPPVRIDGFPKLQKNTFGLSFFVYGNMVDVMRHVSEHITVGRAYKYGDETGNYFLLCRMDESA